MCHQRQCFSMQKNLLLQLLLCTKRRWALSWWKQQFLMGIAKLWGSWAMVREKEPWEGGGLLPVARPGL